MFERKKSQKLKFFFFCKNKGRREKKKGKKEKREVERTRIDNPFLSHFYS
jgi:hypothetical protein